LAIKTAESQDTESEQRGITLACEFTYRLESFTDRISLASVYIVRFQGVILSIPVEKHMFMERTGKHAFRHTMFREKCYMLLFCAALKIKEPQRSMTKS
jgi:hypothetical protein